MTSSTRSTPAAVPTSEGGWTLGLGGSAHDFSAALARGSDIRVAVESERITRVKYGQPRWFEDPVAPAVEYCLDAECLSQADVASVVSSDILPYRVLDSWDVKTYPHHRCHAASVAMLLPPGAKACILVYDGGGSVATQGHREDGFVSTLSQETFSMFECLGGDLRLLDASRGVRQPELTGMFDGCTNSLGVLYELVTSFVGFDRLEAGKTMGLAAWGQPDAADILREHLTAGDTVGDALTFDPFDERLHVALADYLTSHGNTFRARANLAASVQRLATDCLLAMYRSVEDRDFDVFGIAGGSGLNTVANGELAKLLPSHRRLLVPPHAGDAGIAFGALWLALRDESGPTSTPWTVRGAPPLPAISRPGRRYPPARSRAAARLSDATAALDLRVRTASDLAALLASGRIIGIFNGPSEIGPRALGGRSILADPRDAMTRERINRLIKHREPFRPLAPILMASSYDDYFEPPAAADPFMLVVATALDSCRAAAPAIVHADGTARVQVIDDGHDTFLCELLSAFGEQTGVPILLNTSFNRRGEPIVETPEQAMAAFLALGLDGLWLDGEYLIPAAPRRGG